MTALTQTTLENALIDVSSMAKGNQIALKPTKMIIPPAYYRYLLWRPALHKARGVRGRKKAINRRAVAKINLLFRGEA